MQFRQRPSQNDRLMNLAVTVCSHSRIHLLNKSTRDISSPGKKKVTTVLVKFSACRQKGKKSDGEVKKKMENVFKERNESM